MDLTLFGNQASGQLVPIAGVDPRHGEWQHQAFVPHPLPAIAPELSREAYMAVADARAAIAALDSTSRRSPNPTLLRSPTLRREAQATSELEGTYAPLGDVLTSDEDVAGDANIREIFNYVRMANHAFASMAEGRPLSVSMLEDLQTILVEGTAAAGPASGQIRAVQVVIGRRPGVSPGELPIRASRYVPTPPGDDLVASMRELVDWMRTDHPGAVDPVVAAALAHYQFEALHPFNDGNGRIGRLLVVLHLQALGLLAEPTLTISPWFEARRTEYYDRLFGVSADGDWDGYVGFFARGLAESAAFTHRQMVDLLAVRDDLADVVRGSDLRADSALLMVDVAVANTAFNVKRAAALLGLSVGRSSQLIAQLVDLGVLEQLGDSSYNRRFVAPRVLDVLLGS